MTFKWLFLDLNSYFASVEQELRPELRGKPIAVVPVMANTTCAIAASIEAKRFGIKTGTLVSDMKKICPGIILVQARHEAYVEAHHRIVEAVESCAPITAVMSIDEMACELLGSQRTTEGATKLAHQMKAAIREKAGKTLRCSVGVAPNRFLAKVASDMQKPDGLTFIAQEDLPLALHCLKLRDFPGIGPRMERRLNQKLITTTEQLLALSKEQMRTIWGGIHGDRFWAWLRGEDIDGPKTKRRSLGHSHVLPPKLRSAEGAYAVLQRLTHKAAARLRRNGYWARALFVAVKFSSREGGRSTWVEQAKLIECQDTLTLLQTVNALWLSSFPKKEQVSRPYAVSITLTDLVKDAQHNFSFFSEEKRSRLSHSMDRINTKFGKNTIFFGAATGALESAQTRIAFTNVPDFDEFEE